MWTIFLCNSEGWWDYQRWVSKPILLKDVFSDIVYAIDSGIIRPDVVITVTESPTLNLPV